MIKNEFKFFGGSNTKSSKIVVTIFQMLKALTTLSYLTDFHFIHL